MTITNDNQYLSVSAYMKAVSVLTEFTKIILYSYAMYSNETRDSVIRNFIARSITSLNGLLQLWQARDYHDCWLLYRAILDRFFHLESLGRENTFELFEKCCFKKRYRYKLRCLSDPELRGKIDASLFSPSQEDQERYNSIKNETLTWKRPKAKEIASDLNLGFLYSYGYDFASTYVHPSAVEGQEDFSRLTGIDTGKSFDDQITVIHNSCLVTNMIIHDGLLFSQLKWRSPILRFINDFFSFIHKGSDKYPSTLRQIFQMANENVQLCRPATEKADTS